MCRLPKKSFLFNSISYSAPNTSSVLSQRLLGTGIYLLSFYC